MDIKITLDPEEVISVIKEFIETYIENSGCSSVVIGLSGGVDSAVTALLCKEALGKKRVNCIFLPDENTPDIDRKHLDIFVKKYDFKCETAEITDVVREMRKSFIVKPNKYALANVKARVRMIFLFEYANMTNSLVCGTSNKSEMLVGYFTKYGDGGVDIQPIGDLYKTQIFELAKYLRVPMEIISKPPSAGLWNDQFDEKELKLSYRDLDRILLGLERKMNPKDIAKVVGVKVSEVERVRNLRIKSQHKRRLALIPKVGLRTPGLDWRAPVQEG